MGFPHDEPPFLGGRLDELGVRRDDRAVGPHLFGLDGAPWVGAREPVVAVRQEAHLVIQPIEPAEDGLHAGLFVQAGTPGHEDGGEAKEHFHESAPGRRRFIPTETQASLFAFFHLLSPEVPGGGLSSLMTTGTIIGTARTREVGNKMQAQARKAELKLRYPVHRPAQQIRGDQGQEWR